MNKEESEGYVKTSINNCLKKMAEQPEEFFDNYKLQEKYNKVIKENTNLKQALNEIRKKIKDKGQRHQMAVLEQMIVEDFCLDSYECSDILQIIDKVLGDERNGI